MSKIYIAVDIETTGLSKKVDKIIELGAVAFEEDGTIVGRFDEFVKTDFPIPMPITQLTGITTEMLRKQGILLKEMLKQFKSWVDENGVDREVRLIAHNSIFDCGFIKRDCDELGIDFDYTIYDTLKISRKLIPTLAKHDLGTLCKVFGIDNKSHHRADNDAEVLSQLFCILIKSMKIKNISIEEFE